MFDDEGCEGETVDSSFLSAIWSEESTTCEKIRGKERSGERGGREEERGEKDQATLREDGFNDCLDHSTAREITVQLHRAPR